MMRHSGMLVFLFLLGLGASACAATPESSLAPLKKWVGVFALGEKNAKKIWDDPVLQAEAHKALDQEYFDLVFNGYAKQVTAPVEQKGDVLFAFACKAHACNTDQVKLFVDLAKNTIAVCVRKTGVEKDMWFSPSKPPRALEDEGCAIADDFVIYERHGKE